MEKKLNLRILRRMCMGLLALLLMGFATLHVMAETPKAASDSAESTALTQENFAAVAVQLEAVARSEGKAIANQMLYASMQSVSAMSAPMDARSAAVPFENSENTPPVVVHTEAENTWSFSGILPFLLVAIVAVGAMLVAFSTLQQGGRSNVSHVYRPMRRRNFYEDTFKKGKVIRLDR